MSVQKDYQLPLTALIPALLLIISGGLFALYYLIFDPRPYSFIEAAQFLVTIPVPFDWIQIGPISFPITVDNFLVFQEFKALAPIFRSTEALVFGAIVWLVVSASLALISEFKKTYFLIAAVVWIALLTFSNFNGLNIGGPSSNFPLIIIICGSLIPIVYFHIWGERFSYWIKWLASLLSSSASLFVLVKFSPIISPEIYIAHHSTVLAIGLSIAWIFWSGHSILSGSYILLSRANRNLGMKISVQIVLISLLYLIILFTLFLALTGESILYFPTFNPLYLLVPIGIIGWLPLNAKIDQVKDLAAGSIVLKTLYLLGFGLSLWLAWKLKISGNQPAEELVKHLLVYSQFGFSLFFLVYILSNFLSVMDLGKSVDQILFKPYSLPYYHLRIGGLITMLVLTTYSEGIVGVQVNSMTNNILGDYYYETDQKLEASILYENAWARYRNNPKAKHTTAQLLFQLNQPTLAKQHLEESFAEAPQVDNIILISDRLHLENKIFESVYYLERGLRIFPNDPRLINNLALFYSKINRSKDGLALLEEAEGNDPTLKSNLSALRTKSGQPVETETTSNELSAQLNQLAASNALGNIPSEDLIESINQKLKSQVSPMLFQAGLRNLWSQKDRTDPQADLNLLDSLGKLEGMQDYIMNLQETAVIRSFAAGRVTEAIKNLNGLAFRNPGDAGYFLQLSTSILAQNLDFKKAAVELLAAEEKGFQAFQPHHLAILNLGGMPEKAEEIRQRYEVIFPIYLNEQGTQTSEYLKLIARFNESLGSRLWESWITFPKNELKTDLAIRLIAHKSHDLSPDQLKQLAKHISNEIGPQEKLDAFIANPDGKNPESLKAYLEWLNASEELNSNPYLTPLILFAEEKTEDSLLKYEILNTATEFNRDPILWMKKIRAASKIGLDTYSYEAFMELNGWVSDQDLEKLQRANF